MPDRRLLRRHTRFGSYFGDFDLFEGFLAFVNLSRTNLCIVLSDYLFFDDTYYNVHQMLNETPRTRVQLLCDLLTACFNLVKH